MTRVLPITLHDTQVVRHNATGWWLEEAGTVEPLPALDRSIDADVVVIGGGYTGMWTAWHLLEAGATVAVLDAGLCGQGPSDHPDFADWLDRTDTPEEERARIAELLDSRLRDGRLELPTVILKGVKR